VRKLPGGLFRPQHAAAFFYGGLVPPALLPGTVQKSAL
jgi:hypothetical protein